MSSINTFTIPSGTAESNVVDLTQSDCRYVIMFNTPAAMPETVNIGVCETTGGVFSLLRSGGTVITLAAGFADEPMVIQPIAIKLISVGNVAADRVIQAIRTRY